jgi:pimeloyl-ACP methyl ester carboxylesterase
MEIARTLAGGAIRLAGGISPRAGAAMALPLFMRIPTPRPVSSRDEETMWAARRDRVRIPGVTGNGVDVLTYEWGRGPTVVLAHGWHGRASQLATLARELVSEGFRVVAFDAPAHGETRARGTYIGDWLDVLTALRDRHGRLHAVVGHSFGGLAALVAVIGGLAAERVVTVSAPADGDALLDEFQARLRYDDDIAAQLRAGFARRFFPEEPDALRRLSGISRPLPAGVELLVAHDEEDPAMPFREAVRLIQTHPGSRLLATEGLGHNRILTADAFLDEVLAFVGEPSAVRAGERTPPVARLRPAAT